MEYANLDRFFFPRGIVLISAPSSSGKMGDDIWSALSPRYSRHPLYRISLDDHWNEEVARLPAGTDLAVIVAPPDIQMEVACACDARGIRSALLLNPARREPTAADMPGSDEDIQRRCPNGLRILGPQSFGLISPHHDLNITMGLPMPRAGTTAFVSQSSALCAAVLDWSFRTRVGFSAVVACDAMPDVSWGDLLTHFGDDPQTKTIIVYLENVGHARGFLSAAREVALNKPIIMLKSRRASALAQAPDSGTREDPRTDTVFDAALRRVGVLRVRTISEMFYMANILANQPLPRGPRLSIITNSMAPARLAVDALLGSGGALAAPSDETPNPLNLGGNAKAHDYALAVETVSRDKDSDGILIIVTPQADTEPTLTASRLVEKPGKAGKPLLASWMGADSVTEGQDILYRSGIPAFPYPDTPARLFALMWRHAQNLNGIYETPSVIIDEDRVPVDPDAARALLESLRQDNHTLLTPEQAAKVLGLYGIPIFPDKEPPADSYKLLAGSRMDPEFGPYMVFGIGGRMSAIYDDIAIGLPPLTSALALRMMEQSAVWKVLRPAARDNMETGHRVAQLQGLLVRLSQLVIQQPLIRRLNINPLYVSGDSILVTAASISLHSPSVNLADLPRPAIRPYPVQYTWHETARDGSPLIVRPVRPEDEPLIIDFHRLLSEETIYRRYFFQHKFTRRTSHERLRRTCFLDFDREIALAALLDQEGGPAIAAVGRLARNRAGDSAEIALTVADPFQSLGIGTLILRHLVDVARAEGLSRVQGSMLPGNIHMQHLFGKLGFSVRPGADDTVVAELMLQPATEEADPTLEN